MTQRVVFSDTLMNSNNVEKSFGGWQEENYDEVI